MDEEKIVFVAEHNKKFTTYDMTKTVFEHRFPEVAYYKDNIKKIVALKINCEISESHIISVDDTYVTITYFHALVYAAMRYVWPSAQVNNSHVFSYS